MRSRDLQKEFAETFRGRSASDIDQRFRVLREVMGEKGRAKTAPRGINAPHLSPVEVAIHVLSLVARRPGDLSTVLPRLSECKCIPHPLLPAGVANAGGDGGLFNLPVAGTSLLDAVIAAVLNYRGWHNFEIAEDGDLAWLTYRGDVGGEASPLGIKLLFSIDHEKVHASIKEEADGAARRKQVDPRNSLLMAYDEIDRNTRGSRFVVNGADLYLMGVRATQQHPELRKKAESSAARLRTELAQFKDVVVSATAAIADGRLSAKEAQKLAAALDPMMGELLAMREKLQKVDVADDVEPRP